MVWVWGALGALVVLVGSVVAVVKYVRGAEANKSALSERDAELEVEHQRQRQMDAAAQEARKARRESLREKVDSADSAGVDKLLRDLTSADDPNLN